MVALFVVVSCVFFLGVNGQVYDQLYHTLLNNGGLPTIPMFNRSTPLTVKFSMMLVEVLELNTDRLYIDALGWVYSSWTDRRLRWDAQIYDVDDLPMSQDLLWTPDIIMYNSHDMKNIADVKAVVKSNGEIILVKPTRFRSSCNRSSYSSDRLECKMKFGSWVYSNNKLDLQPFASQDNAPDMSAYEENPRWELVKAEMVRNVKEYAGWPERYEDITYTFTFRGAQ